MKMGAEENDISLRQLIKRFRSKVSVTWLLVALEGLSLLLMPLVIGRAVDGLINGERTGLFQLGGLCLFLLIAGAGRRFYDTRIYGRIFRIVSAEIVRREATKKTTLSATSARVNLFSEFIEFLENTMPEIINQFLGFSGTLCIIYFFDVRVFSVCLAGAFLIVLLYLFNQTKMFNLNRGQNDEFEKQIEILSTNQPDVLKIHLKKLMSWRIKLSDLETTNYSITWIILTSVLIFSVLAVSSPEVSLGHVISIIMYVFGFLESVISFPLYYQQVVRLQEIGGRLG